jgi:hypothetical protein
MRTIRRVVPLVGVLAALIVGGVVSVSASNNATWHTSFSVAVVTSLVNNSVDGNIGAIPVGILNGGPVDDLTINSNDTAGVQLTVAAPAATITESGVSPCVPVGSHTVPASVSQMTGSPTTGGSGGVAGTAAATIIVSTTAQNVFATVPTNTGALDEHVTLNVLLPAATAPNSIGCSYLLTFSYTLIAQ